MSLERKWYTEELYQVSIWHFWSSDPDKVFARLEKDGLNLLDTSTPRECRGFCLEVDDTNHTKGDHYFVIWTPRKGGVYSLLHETSHLVHKIFKYKGALVDADNTEAITYYHEYLFRMLLPNIKKTKEKK